MYINYRRSECAAPDGPLDSFLTTVEAFGAFLEIFLFIGDAEGFGCAGESQLVLVIRKLLHRLLLRLFVDSCLAASDTAPWSQAYVALANFFHEALPIMDFLFMLETHV